VRPFNTYGPRQSARAVIPTVITQIAAGKKEIRLGSVTPTRDFTYVSDTVAGFVSALKNEGTLGEVVNLGSGFEISIGETAKLIGELMNESISIISDEQRFRPENSEVERLLADNSKANQLLNWQPKKNGIEGFTSGLELTIKWFSNPENLTSFKTDIYNK
jgi:nucleoside-diphosphate-sugar epimerase